MDAEAAAVTGFLIYHTGTIMIQAADTSMEHLNTVILAGVPAGSAYIQSFHRTSKHFSEPVITNDISSPV